MASSDSRCRSPSHTPRRPHYRIHHRRPSVSRVASNEAQFKVIVFVRLTLYRDLAPIGGQRGPAHRFRHRPLVVWRHSPWAHSAKSRSVPIRSCRIAGVRQPRIGTGPGSPGTPSKAARHQSVNQSCQTRVLGRTKRSQRGRARPISRAGSPTCGDGPAMASLLPHTPHGGTPCEISKHPYSSSASFS